MSYKQAKEKYYEEGMDDLFTFEEYLEYLARCHVTVYRNEA